MDLDALQQPEDELFENASPSQRRRLKEFAACIRDTPEDNQDCIGRVRGAASGVVIMLNPMRAQHISYYCRWSIAD
jgi:hypothetical protein